MLLRFLLLIIIFCFHGLAEVSAQVSNKGKHFYIGYGHNDRSWTESDYDNNGGMTMVLYLSADSSAVVDVRITGTGWTRRYHIPANSVITTEKIPDFGQNDSRIKKEGISGKSIEIISDVPIVAYSHTYYNASSGATLLLPTEAYGSSYTAVCGRQNFDTSWVSVPVSC